jgi:hypothetical protein
MRSRRQPNHKSRKTSPLQNTIIFCQGGDISVSQARRADKVHACSPPPSSPPPSPPSPPPPSPPSPPPPSPPRYSQAWPLPQSKALTGHIIHMLRGLLSTATSQACVCCNMLAGLCNTFPGHQCVLVCCAARRRHRHPALHPLIHPHHLLRRFPHHRREALLLSANATLHKLPI